MKFKMEDQVFIDMLKELRETDYEAFAEVVLNSLKAEPQFAVEDSAPAETKLNALKVLREWFEEQERYEDCAYVAGLEQKIKDAEKG